MVKPKHKLPFQVPENYFEELPSRILELIENQRKPSLHRRVDRVFHRFAYAAVFVGLMMAGYIGFRLVRSNPPANGMTADEISNTIEYLGYEINDEMLISAIIEADIDLSPKMTDEETDAIIQSLSEENLGINDIINDD